MVAKILIGIGLLIAFFGLGGISKVQGFIPQIGTSPKPTQVTTKSISFEFQPTGTSFEQQFLEAGQAQNLSIETIRTEFEQLEVDLGIRPAFTQTPTITQTAKPTQIAGNGGAPTFAELGKAFGSPEFDPLLEKSGFSFSEFFSQFRGGFL